MKNNHIKKNDEVIVIAGNHINAVQIHKQTPPKTLQLNIIPYNIE